MSFFRCLQTEADKYVMIYLGGLNKLLKIEMFSMIRGAVMVVIIWYLDLQLPMQSVPITTKVVSSNPAQAKCT